MTTKKILVTFEKENVSTPIIKAIDMVAFFQKNNIKFESSPYNWNSNNGASFYFTNKKDEQFRFADHESVLPISIDLSTNRNDRYIPKNFILLDEFLEIKNWIEEELEIEEIKISYQKKDWEIEKAKQEKIFWIKVKKNEEKAAKARITKFKNIKKAGGINCLNKQCRKFLIKEKAFNIGENVFLCKTKKCLKLARFHNQIISLSKQRELSKCL